MSADEGEQAVANVPCQLSDEQLYQLHELMTVTKEIYDPSKAQSQPPGGQKAVEEAVEDALDRAKREEKQGG